jgi:hypothetical protein
VTAEEKLDRLSEQLGAVGVQLATLSADVRALRSDLTRTASETAHDVADHEARLRVLEAHGTADHGRAIAELQRWRAQAIGYAAGAAGVGGIAGAALSNLLHLHIG